MTANRAGDDSRLAELLLRWEELHEQGRSLSPEELSSSCPELAGELARRIALLRRVDPLQGDTKAPANAPDTVVGEPAPPRALWPPPRLLRLSLPPMSPGPSAATGSIRRLGQGGFGRVYLARDDELDRPVAIKVPNPERVAGPEDVEAYLAEARALAKLDHPQHRPGLRRGPDRRRPLLRGLEVHRGERPGGADAAGPAVVPGVGRAGGGGRRGAAPRPYAGPGPPRHQARQHPARRSRASRAWPTSGWRSRTRTTAREPGSPGRPPT